VWQLSVAAQCGRNRGLTSLGFNNNPAFSSSVILSASARRHVVRLCVISTRYVNIHFLPHTYSTRPSMVASQDSVSQQEPPLDVKRKRKSLSIPNSPSKNSVHPCKRRKNRVTATTSTKFWDNLSKQYLTKNALQELDDRNTRGKQPGCPIQRATEITAPVDQYLRECTPTRLRDIERFAQSGNIDLTDLRGV
jgi:hypothetical protein